MNIFNSLILGITISIFPGIPGNMLFIKPTATFTPREVIINQSNWELVKSKKQIKVYSQWVTLYDGFETRRLRGNFQVNMPIPDIVKFISNGNNLKSWMDGAIESYNLDQTEHRWTSYAQFNIPWPFDDQDLVVESMLLYPPTSDSAYIVMESLSERLPEHENISRMSYFSGYWKLNRISENKTLVEYCAFTKSKPLVPRFIQDPIVQNSFWSSLDNLSTHLQIQNH